MADDAKPDDPKAFKVDMTAPIIVDGKPWKDAKTHDPADWVEVKEGSPKELRIKCGGTPNFTGFCDTDPECQKCKDETLGAVVALVLMSIRKDETTSDKMPMFESWKAWADEIKGEKAVALTGPQMKLIEDRVNAILAVPSLATAVKKMIDPNYKVELPK